MKAGNPFGVPNATAVAVAGVLLVLVLLGANEVNGTPEFPDMIRYSMGHSSCLESSYKMLEELIESNDMLMRTAQTYLALPFDTFADYILNPSLLATWNGDYSSGGPQTELPLCGKLLANFTTKFNVTVPSGYSFQPPIIITVNRTRDVALFGWTFGVDDGKDNYIEWGAHWIGGFRQKLNDGGQEAVLFVSWEKVYGDLVEKNRDAFNYGLSKTVLQKDINGAMCLDQVYSLEHRLDVASVNATCGHNQD